MENVEIYMGLAGVLVIFIIVWWSIQRKGRKEVITYGEQQIRNPGEPGGTETIGGSPDDKPRDKPGVTENSGGEPDVKGEPTRDETTKGDGERSDIQTKPVNINSDDEQPVESDSTSTKFVEQADEDDEEDEEDIPEVDSI